MSRLDKAPRGLPGPLGVVAPQTGKTTSYVVPSVDIIPGPVVAEPVEPPRRKKKVGGWNDYPENYERIRRAWYATRALPDGFESISDMIATVLMRQAEEWEREHNGGQPFPEPPGKVRHSNRT